MARLSILNFSIGFANFFKLSQKIPYYGPIYPKNRGHIDISLIFSFFSYPSCQGYNITVKGENAGKIMDQSFEPEKFFLLL